MAKLSKVVKSWMFTRSWIESDELACVIKTAMAASVSHEEGQATMDHDGIRANIGQSMFTAVEFPGYVRNTQKALSMIGGTPAVAALGENGSTNACAQSAPLPTLPTRLCGFQHWRRRSSELLLAPSAEYVDHHKIMGHSDFGDRAAAHMSASM
eukprot:1159741-Pelagomonas_calceolata.AAC.13